MNIKELKELFKLVERTDFSEVDVRQGELRINIKRNTGVTYAQTQVVSEPIRTVEIRPQVEAASPAKVEKATEIPVKGTVVNSPFVGTFYRAPAPDAKPFVDVGSKVKKGDTLCIVEAMKLMNEIETEVDGIVKQIYVENAQPVEFGEKLFLIEPV